MANIARAGPPGVLGRQFMLSSSVYSACQPPAASPQRLLPWLLVIHTEYTIQSGERLGCIVFLIPYDSIL